MKHLVVLLTGSEKRVADGLDDRVALREMVAVSNVLLLRLTSGLYEAVVVRVTELVLLLSTNGSDKEMWDVAVTKVLLPLLEENV